MIRGDVIEPLVWQALRDLLHNPKLIAQAWNVPSASEDATRDSGEEDRLRHRLKALDRQQERLLDLFQDEQIEKDAYLQRKHRLDQERLTIDQRMKQLSQQAYAEQAKEQMMSDFAQYCRQIETNLDNPTPEIQQEVIRLLIDHVVVGENEIVIKHIVPTDDDCRLQPRRKGTRRFLRFSFVYLHVLVINDKSVPLLSVR